MMRPLNGTKTHALSLHGLESLRSIERAPKPRQEFNPGAANRLIRGQLAESINIKSPYATHRGKNIEHLSITEAGLRLLAEMKAGSR